MGKAVELFEKPEKTEDIRKPFQDGKTAGRKDGKGL